jgi:RNA polymerase sigma factor (sigma-70 family)
VDRGNTLKSWCLKIADRVILDYRRGRPVLGMRQAPRAVELVSFEEVAEILGTDPFDDEVDLAGPAPEARDGHPQEPSHSELVVQAFDSLNEVDRTILWGTLVDGESDKYLAKVTGKPEDQIRKIRYKAIAKLRKAFDRLVLGARQAS